MKPMEFIKKNFEMALANFTLETPKPVVQVSRDEEYGDLWSYKSNLLNPQLLKIGNRDLFLNTRRTSPPSVSHKLIPSYLVQ